MSDNDEITPERAVKISQRIDDAFDFIRDAIETPQLLEEIPDDSTLWARDIRVGQVRFRLVAHQTKGKPGQWTARVTSPAVYAQEALLWRPPTEVRAVVEKWSSPATSPETGNSADAALDTLEEKLRDSRHRFEDHHRAVGS